MKLFLIYKSKFDPELVRELANRDCIGLPDSVRVFKRIRTVFHKDNGIELKKR